MKILIGGDFYVSDKYSKSVKYSSSLISLFNKGDFRIVNQEAPITANNPKNRILKTGPYLFSKPETATHLLKKLNIDLVTLANNHIMDYGEKGLIDTFEELKNQEIAFIGAGANLNEASTSASFTICGIKIAILNFCENEWSVADINSPGANPLDIINNVKQIRSLKETHDTVIVIIHGGHEFYHLPSPRMVKQYRFYAENGASVVVGHHPHFISGYEVHQNVPIFYSLGNFIFTIPETDQAWYIGIVLALSININGNINFELNPVKQDKDTFELSLVEGVEKKSILDEIHQYNNIISNEALLSKYWDEFLHKTSGFYLNLFSPVNFLGSSLKYLFIKTKLDQFFLRKDHFKKIYNLIRCEAHSDASKEIIKEYLKVKS
jgi:poly-gamma-glutamate capsule biosynthesis protein CapA/YwtB (metallophosphatase superfamily)